MGHGWCAGLGGGLPTLEQLDALWAYRVNIGIDSFALGNYYWSSRDAGDNVAFIIFFWTGAQTHTGHTNMSPYVRCVRTF
jgi:hypothetical protein